VSAVAAESNRLRLSAFLFCARQYSDEIIMKKPRKKILNLQRVITGGFTTKDTKTINVKRKKLPITDTCVISIYSFNLHS